MTGSSTWGEAAELAQAIEAAGFSGMLYTETGQVPWMQLAAAAMAAPSLTFTTGIAVAFPRSPMVSAQLAWELAGETKGRFRLGLGSQVKGHVVRRYSSEFDRPDELAPLIRRAKTQVAFYGTTPNYSFQFTDLGYEGVTERLRDLMRTGDIAGMAEVITDDMLEHFAVVAPWNEMADRLKDRYGATAARVVMYLAEEQIRKDPDMVHKWGEVARATRS